MAEKQKLGEAFVEITGKLKPLKDAIFKAESMVKSMGKTLSAVSLVSSVALAPITFAFGLLTSAVRFTISAIKTLVSIAIGGLAMAFRLVAGIILGVLSSAIRLLTGLLRGLKNVIESVIESISKWAKRLILVSTIAFAWMTKRVIQAGSELVELENLFQVSLGRMVYQARQFANAMSRTLFLDPVEVKRSVGVFDVMLKGMELNEQAAFDMSIALSRLAFDLSSFYNISTSDAFEKLRAGIIGEVRPLRELGIEVSEAQLRQLMLTMGIKKQLRTMTQQERIWLRFIAIMQATKAAQGDLQRTLQSPANVFRAIGQGVTNLSRQIGMRLLVVLQEAFIWIREFVWYLGRIVEAGGFDQIILNMGMAIRNFINLIATIGVQGLQQFLYLVNQIFGGLAKFFAWLTIKANDPSFYKWIWNFVLALTDLPKVINAVWTILKDRFEHIRDKFTEWKEGGGLEQMKEQMRDALDTIAAAGQRVLAVFVGIANAIDKIIFGIQLFALYVRMAINGFNLFKNTVAETFGNIPFIGRFIKSYLKGKANMAAQTGRGLISPIRPILEKPNRFSTPQITGAISSGIQTGDKKLQELMEQANQILEDIRTEMRKQGVGSLRFVS